MQWPLRRYDDVVTAAIDSPSQPDVSATRSGLVVLGAGATGLAVVDRIAHIIDVTLIDKDASRLEDGVADPSARRLRGDGTSALVQREAGVREASAFIACTADDETNIEASRIAVELGVPSVICRLLDSRRKSAVMALGAQPVTGKQAMAGALLARLPGVVATTSEVGLGQGEILQVRVMPGSLVIGRTIAEVATREYLVAAIYRAGELIVPHGDTRVDAGDQVLLVGEPETLRAIADYFRLGGAQFPLQFGRSVVLWDPADERKTFDEAQWIADLSGITRFHRVVPYGTPMAVDPPSPTPVPLGPTALELPDPMLATKPGVLVIEAPQRTVLGLQDALPLRTLYNRARSPVLLSRGTHPYRSILVPVGGTATSWHGLDLAIDVARMMGARITALHCTQPQFLGGSLGAERATAVVDKVETVAALYGLELDLKVIEGNPVRAVAKEAVDHELVVVARRRNQPDSYFRPDVGLRIALQVPCSALLLSFD